MNWLRYGCAISAVVAAATFGGPSAAFAQDYPTRTIRLVVVTAAGGLMDVAARVTAEYVGKALGQSIVIENRPGGGGNLGAEAIAKAPPDGYTIGLIQLGNVAINPHIYADMTFDPLNDLVPGAAQSKPASPRFWRWLSHNGSRQSLSCQRRPTPVCRGMNSPHGLGSSPRKGWRRS